MSSPAPLLAPVDVGFLVECGAPFEVFSPRPQADGQVFYVLDVEGLTTLGWIVAGGFTPPPGQLRRPREVRVGAAVMLVQSEGAAVPSGTVGEAVAAAADTVQVLWPGGARSDLMVGCDRWVILD